MKKLIISLFILLVGIQTNIKAFGSEVIGILAIHGIQELTRDDRLLHFYAGDNITRLVEENTDWSLFGHKALASVSIVLAAAISKEIADNGVIPGSGDNVDILATCLGWAWNRVDFKYEFNLP